MKDLRSTVYDIEVCQQKIENLKNSILEETQNGKEYTQEEIDFFYWQTKLNVNLISKHDESRNFVKIKKPTPIEYVTECESCQCEHTIIVTSRDKFNLLISNSRNRPKTICESCKLEIKNRSKKQSMVYELRIKKQTEEYKKLISIPYKDYLQSDHWKTFRAKVIRRYDGRCQLCNSKDKRLNVHHRSYENKGRENYTDVILLCEDCHAKHHGK